MAAPTPDTAWVTLATTDGYAVGALVLAHSLRAVGTQHQLHVMFTQGVSAEMRAQLQQNFDACTEVNVLDSGDAENLALIGRPNLGVTFTKLHCWRLTQYSKCVFLDADTFVVQNCDELFDRPEFSAAPDIGWPDIFNTGVFVFVPSNQTYHNLLEFATSNGSFDGGDQGLLNAYFSGWRESDASHRLPFVYNVTAGAIYSYAAALKKYAPQIKVIHFLGKQKPWMVHYAGSVGGTEFVSEYHQQWRNVYTQLVQQHLPASVSVSNPSASQSSLSAENRLSAALEQQLQSIHELIRSSNRSFSTSSEGEDSQKPTQLGSIVVPRFPPHRPPIEQSASSSHQSGLSGYEAWEAGTPDYLGADAFANIQKAIQKSLE